MAKIELNSDDPFFTEVQDGKIDVKCAKSLEEALRESATQLKIKYPELVRVLLKQAVIGLAQDGKVKLDQVPMSKKRTNGA